MGVAVNEYVANLKQDGARSNYFRVEVTNPVISQADNILPFLCEGAEIPESQINKLTKYYQGRTLKFAGVRPDIPDWNITVTCDEDYMIRNAIEAWHNYINSMRGNLRKFATASPQEYKSVISVTQLSKIGGTDVRKYTGYGAWPTTVGNMRLDWSQDGILVFPVTFSIDWWEITDGVTGNGGGAD